MKSFNKHYLKRNPASGEVAIESGKPVLGEIGKKDCRLEQRHADILNKDWESTGIYYQEVKEAKEVKAPKVSKAELVAECEALEIESTGTVDVLTERIANHKAKGE